MNEHTDDPTITISLPLLRRILREELASALGLGDAPPASQGAAPAPYPVDPGAVALFADTLPPGEPVPACELYERFREWAGREGLGAARMTGTAFGRAAMASGRFTRQGKGRRYYRPGNGCVGAPGCPNPMLKMSDRCAEHQEPAEG